MKIDVNRFCGLSRRDDFQEWLKSTSEDYYNELISFLKLGKSCGDNKNKMEEIYQKLTNDNKSGLLISFLKNRYPHMLIKDATDDKKIGDKKNDLKQDDNLKKIDKITMTFDDLNYHKVFSMYKPGIMLLPHQLIFLDTNEESLKNRIINFIRTKVQTDYIILKGPKFFHGYVEYFEKRFSTEAANFKMSDRPIFLYKKNHNIS